MRKRVYACTFAALLPMLLACHDAAKQRYVTHACARGSIQETIIATGQVEARNKTTVGSQISGTVRRVAVTYNDAVRKGQVLAEIDPRLYAAQLERAEASVRLMQANAAKARLDEADKGRVLRRARLLQQQNLVAEADLEAAEVAHASAEASILGAQASLVQAEADRALARANLAFTKIVSPIDGLVLDRQVDAGQTVAAQFQVATLFTIAADLQRVQVVVNVDEADVGKLSVPLQVQFRVAAYPGHSFYGTLVEVRPSPTANTSNGGSAAALAGGVVSYAAVVLADNPDKMLRQGMTAELTAVVAEAHDVVLVPAAALRWAPHSAAPTTEPVAPPATATDDARPDVLWVLRGQRPEPRHVRLGLSDGQYVAVAQGLAVGDVVVLAEMDESLGRKTRRGLW